MITKHCHIRTLSALALLLLCACAAQHAPAQKAGDVSPARFGSIVDDTTLFGGQASNASDDSDVAISRGREGCWVQILIDGTSDPVGTMQLHGFAGSSSANSQALPLTSVFDNSAGITHTTNTTDIGIADTIGDVVAKILIPIDNPPPRLFVRWTRSGGGTTGNRLNGSVECRD